MRRTIAVFILAFATGLSAMAGAQVASWPAENPPRPLASRPVSFPPYELRTLPNGMQVIVVMHHEQPEVTMRILVRAGAAYDPPGKSGTAALAASLLNQGTNTRSAQEIADTIDFIGGALDTGAGSDVTSASVLVMKDSFDVGMRMLADGEARLDDFPAMRRRALQHAVQIALDVQINHRAAPARRHAVHFGDGAADAVLLVEWENAHAATLHRAFGQGRL